MNKERIALALSLMSGRMKFKYMSNDELVLLGFERVLIGIRKKEDITATNVKSQYDKSEAIAMAEAIILEALTFNEKGI